MITRKEDYATRFWRKRGVYEEDEPLFGITLHEAPKPTRPLRRRLNYTTIYCAICLAVWLAAEVWEFVRH